MLRKHKSLFLVLLVIVLTFSLVGCGGQKAAKETSQASKEQKSSSTKLKGGKYLVKYDVSKHGNYPMAVMEIKDKKITSFDYQEYLASSGKTKSLKTYPYKPAAKVIPKLNQQFMKKENLEEINFDVVSGATHTKNNFRQAAKDLMKKARNGNTYTPKYEDGVYKAKAEKSSHGWLGKIKVVVEHGQIVGVNYKEVAVKNMKGEKVVFDKKGNPVKKNGKKKTKPVQIKKGDIKSKKNYRYLPAIKAMQNFEYQIINNNGPTEMNFDVVSGATHTKNKIVRLAEKALQEAAK